MNKLMYRFVTTRKKKKKKKKKEIDPFLDTVCPFRASRVKRNHPVFRHGMPPQGIPRKKQIKFDAILITCSGLKCAVFKRKFHHFEAVNRKNNF